MRLQKHLHAGTIPEGYSNGAGREGSIADKLSRICFILYGHLSLSIYIYICICACIGSYAVLCALEVNQDTYVVIPVGPDRLLAAVFDGHGINGEQC